MKRLTTALAFLISLLSSTGVESAQDNSEVRDSGPTEPQLIKPEALQGCYELGTLSWRPDLGIGEDKEFITPPARIKISAERGTVGFEKNGYLVRPAPGVPRSIHRASYWIPKGPNALELVWTTGLSGLYMRLKFGGETLRGKATSFWDFPRRKQSATIVAHKVDCAEEANLRIEGIYRNPSQGYSIEVPDGLKATTGDQAGPERGVTVSLESGGRIVVFGEPNSLDWGTPVEGVRVALDREKCPSGHSEVSSAPVGDIPGAKGSLLCGDRVVVLFLAFRTGGGPLYWVRLDTRQSDVSNDEAILQKIAASLKLIPWE